MTAPRPLPTDWRWCRFDEVAEISSNLIDPKRCPEAVHIAPNHIESGTGKLLEYQTVAEDGVTSGKHGFHAGQILYSKIRPYLAKAVLVDFDGVCSADMYPIDSKIDRRYLMRWLICPEFVQLVSRSQGRTVLPKINQNGLNAMPVPVPPPGEDTRIADRIEALTQKSRRAKEALDAIPPLLERFRQSVLASAFRGDLTKDWRAKHPGVEPAEALLKRIRTERRKRWEEAEFAKLKAKGKAPKDDRWKDKYEEPAPVDTEGLPELPVGWCWASAGELCECIVPNRDKPKSFSGGTPWVTLPDLADRFVVNGNRNGQGLSPEEVARDGARVVPTGSVVMSCVGRFGVACVTGVDLVINQQLHAFLPPPQLDARHLAFCLQWQRRYMEGRATSTTIAYLNKNNCNSVPVPLAPTAEQQVIAERLVAADDTTRRIVSSQRAAAAQLDRCNASILAKAFRGELTNGRDDA